MKRIRGMFTAELSLVLCISFFVIFSSVYLGFFSYDICVTKAVISMITRRAAAEDRDEIWMEEQVEKLSGLLLSCDISDHEITCDDKKSVDVELNCHVPAYAYLYFKGEEPVLHSESTDRSAATFARITEAVIIDDR